MILLIHFVATAFMTGVIWIVQVVTYPQLHLVPRDHFITYEKSHMKRIGLIVGPMMLIEFFTALYLFVKGLIPEIVIVPFYWSLALGITIGLSTAILQAPIHGQLAVEGKVDQKINRLINSNWIRTVCWSGRTLLIAYIIFLSS